MQKKYRVAIVGRTGRGGYGHGLDTSWLKCSRAEIVGVCDEHPQGRETAAQRLGVSETFADYEEMLERTRPDVVTICQRWIDQHHEMMLAAIERGIHVYIEKPFCRDLQEADEIVAAAERRHVHIAIAHPTHYSPTLQTVKRLLRDGAIGQVVAIRGRGKEDRRGGGEDMWVLGSHLFDMQLTLGYRPRWCFASITQQGKSITAADVVQGNEGIGPIAGDVIHATYGLDDGLTSSFESRRGAAGTPSRFGLRIYGSQGIIEIFEGTLPPIYILQSASWAARDESAGWKKISSAGIDRPEPVTDPRYRDRHWLAIENLLNSIESQTAPLCNASVGRDVIEMVLAPYASVRAEGPVQLPLTNREHPLAGWS